MIKILEFLNIFIFFKFIWKKNIKKIFNKIKLLKKGKYIVTISNCISCHTQNGGKPFSGGLPIKTNFGIIFTPNITFSKNGIYNLKFKNFLKLIKNGINKKNKILYPIFPYFNFSKMKILDIKSIYYYLKKIPKENIINIKNNLKSPFKYRNLLIGWRLMFFKKYKFNNLKKLKSSFKRGSYIINSMGHCNICHTSINLLGSNINKLKYSINKINKENWYVTSLLNNISKSLKHKSKQEIFNLLKYGFSKNSYIHGPMNEVINNSLQYINKIDLKSICNYLKILFNKNNLLINNIKILKINKFYSKFFFNKGKLIFKENCYKCHGGLLIGKFPIYPNLKYSFYNKFLNNIINIIYYCGNNNTYKNFFSSIMPNFINKIKYKESYYLINYINFIINLKKN